MEGLAPNTTGEIKIMNDHDLLLVINTKLEYMRGEITDIKNNFAGRVAALEAEKAAKDDLKRIEGEVHAEIERVHKEAHDETARVEDERSKASADHERRLRKLEKFSYGVLGALALYQFIMSFAK